MVNREDITVSVTDGSVLPSVGGRGSKVMSGLPDVNSLSFVFCSLHGQHGSFFLFHSPSVHVSPRSLCSNFLAENTTAKVPAKFPFKIIFNLRQIFSLWSRRHGTCSTNGAETREFSVHVHSFSFLDVTL